MNLRLKRIHEAATPEDGYRVLVDGMWPRGVSKTEARLDEWLKSVAPSKDLRTWFGHDPDRWEEFRKRYLSELTAHRETLRPLAEKAKNGNVTLLFAAKDLERNNAEVVRQYLHMLAGR